MSFAITKARIRPRPWLLRLLFIQTNFLQTCQVSVRLFVGVLLSRSAPQTSKQGARQGTSKQCNPQASDVSVTGLAQASPAWCQ